jgi:SAM-dependent methyltransferase
MPVPTIQFAEWNFCCEPPRAEARHFWFRGFRYFVTPLLRQTTIDLAYPLLLDCGCGTGNNLELLGKFGRAYGFDLTTVGLRIGRQNGRTRLAQASVSAMPFPSDAFDVVTSFDVFVALDEQEERAAVTRSAVESAADTAASRPSACSPAPGGKSSDHLHERAVGAAARDCPRRSTVAGTPAGGTRGSGDPGPARASEPGAHGRSRG